MFVEALGCFEGVFNGRRPAPMVEETSTLERMAPNIWGQVSALIFQEKPLSFRCNCDGSRVAWNGVVFGKSFLAVFVLFVVSEVIRAVDLCVSPSKTSRSDCGGVGP